MSIETVYSEKLTRVNLWDFIGNQGAFRRLPTLTETNIRPINHAFERELAPETSPLEALINYIAIGEVSTTFSRKAVEDALKTKDAQLIKQQEERVHQFIVARYALPPGTPIELTKSYQYMSATQTETMFEEERTRLKLISEGAQVEYQRKVRNEHTTRREQRQILKGVNDLIEFVRELHTALEWNQEVRATRTLRSTLKVALDSSLSLKARTEAQGKFVAMMHGIGEILESERQNGVMDELYGLLIDTNFWYKRIPDADVDKLHDRDIKAIHNSETGAIVEWTTGDEPLPPPGHVVLRHAMPHREISYYGEILPIMITGRHKETSRAIAKGGIKNGEISDDSNGMRLIVESEADIPKVVGKLLGSLRAARKDFTIDQTNGFTQNIFPDGMIVTTEEGEPFSFRYTENTHNKATSQLRKVMQFDLQIDRKSIEVQLLTIPGHLNTIYHKDFFHAGYFITKLFQNSNNEALITRLYNDEFFKYLQQMMNIDSSLRIDSIKNEAFESLMKIGAHRRIMSSGRAEEILTMRDIQLEMLKADFRYLLHWITNPHYAARDTDWGQANYLFQLATHPLLLQQGGTLVHRLFSILNILS